ncbi:hypothetical protein FLAG1_08488 [Fusarium langsethiae]|uniref:Uncharacterized protein n=1 Tax=Fusarium langsethiae TaxID=179993 RepID=A0A0N0DCT9_FUSLA|nr:hypothetical protein FLAG1_08488 [Fusarium langsethiae]GKU05610.1 unnamed protein product [Fusarium langsethiae]
MANKHIVTIMSRKSNASASRDQEIKKLDKPWEKKGVVISITSTELQLVLANGPDKEVENWAAKNLRSQMEEKKLMGDWKPVGGH